jgi:hypothetical protein
MNVFFDVLGTLMTDGGMNGGTMPDRVNGNTKKAADMALAKKAISPDSHRAVHEGRIDFEEARSLGREGSPFGPAPKTVGKNDWTPTKTPCLCGCGELVERTFKAGHDARMFRVAREHLTEGREITRGQREYLETSGKMERVRGKLLRGGAEARRQEGRREVEWRP